MTSPGHLKNIFEQTRDTSYMSMRLRIQPVTTDEKGRKVLSSKLMMPDAMEHRFFFVVEAQDFQESMANLGAPHLISQLMHAMRFGGTLTVECELDRALVMNLQDFMRRWLLWYPELFRWVDIVPQGWIDSPRAEKSDAAIACFSGGVDSFYSYIKLTEDTNVPLRSLMFLQGFDIDLSMFDFYEQTSLYYQNRFQEEGLRLLKVLTNAKDSARKFQLNWGNIGHGIYLAAALHLFAADHNTACIPSSHAPDSPIYPWGSNPITDPLFSSSDFRFIHHDYTKSRYEKIMALSQRDDCLDAIRVCWRIKENQLNCGYCPKCMATLIALEVAKPESWRSAFPKVDDLNSVWRALRKTNLIRFQIEQLEVARHQASLSDRTALAKHIADVIAQKSGQRESWRTRLKARFYQLKLRALMRH